MPLMKMCTQLLASGLYDDLVSEEGSVSLDMQSFISNKDLFLCLSSCTETHANIVVKIKCDKLQ